ncbi:Magnesium transport protein CorA [Anatilimnocola aggregata]|uniref:Magnesium transport protein CorA n=1 Tax=Anatilimnocola aggregata TaxID=2528021 RepID=A0A517Y8E4_9BACT|nr:magnesium/cobalt transporter CorA [Anatilimnocola aggregata]QDU26514.1 Magnesium transport protein CorA [Anatilimnocola aggregata]
MKFRRTHNSKRHELKVKRRTKPGSSPGTIAPDPSQPKPVLHALAYNANGTGVIERDIQDLSEIPKLLATHDVLWINVDGLGDVTTLEKLGEMFKLHRLALEDVVSLHQRAKIDDYSDHMFIVMRMASIVERAHTEQLSLFLGNKWVLTFQGGPPGDSFDRVRQRIRDRAGKICLRGPDYLAYALIDAAIDAYYPVLEVYSERLDELEEDVLERPEKRLMDALHMVKADLLMLRRAIWPMREAVASLTRDASELITDDTRVYLRDCYDHIVQIVDLVETYRELTADLRDLYMSALSNRINETMRVLTIISTLFIPLTFIAGIYGMNFDYAEGAMPLNMPELHSPYGYVACLAVMAVLVAGMLIYFYRQGWIFPSLQSKLHQHHHDAKNQAASKQAP